MKKKTALAAGAALVALILLAVIAPAVVDWNRYKPDVVARLGAELGRPVTIGGPLRLRLLPRPTATAEGGAVGNLPGVQPAEMASIPALHIRLRLLPLLTGRVEVAAVALDRPVLHLRRLPDGRANWRFTPAAPTPAAGAAHPSTPSVPAPAVPPAAKPAAKLPIGAVEVSDGTLTYQSGDGAPLRVDGITARLTMDGAAGPFAAKGSARWGETVLTVAGRLGRLVPDQPASLALTIGLPGADAKLAVAGTATDRSRGRPGGLDLAGRVTLSVPSPDGLSKALGGPARLPLSGPLIGEARLAANAEEASLRDLVLTAGPIQGKGSIVAALVGEPRIDIGLTVPSLDLDALARRPAGPPTAAPRPAAPAAGGTGGGVSVPAAPQGRFALPANLFINGELAIGALSWHGQVARQASLHATLDEGELVVERAGVLLPGGTEVKAEGTLAARNDQPALDGHLGVTADDLREALAWAGVTAASVPADRLHRFALDAALAGSPQAVVLDHLRASLDAMTATGRATLSLAGPRPALSLALAADHVDLDAYLPRRPEPATAPPQSRSASTAPAPVPSVPPPAPPLGPVALPMDAAVDLQIHHLLYRRVVVEDAGLSASLTDGTLAVRRAEAQIGGSTLKATGAMRGLDTATPRLDAFILQVDSPQPGRLARAFGLNAVPALDRLGALTAGASLAGGPDVLDAKLRAAAGDLVVTADGKVATPLGAPRVDLDVGAHADSAGSVLRLLTGKPPRRAVAGPVGLSARVAGDGRALDVSALDLRLGTVRLTGSGQANLTGTRPMVTATLAGNAIDLDQILGAERSGALWPAAMPAGLRFPAAPARPPVLRVVPAAAGGAAHGTPFSPAPLDLDFLRAVDGVVDFRAEALAWRGWQLGAPVAHLVLDNGIATLDRLQGKLLGGTLAMTLRLSGGTLPQLTGAMTVAGADLGQVGQGSAPIRVTRGLLDADARFAAAGRSSADMAARLNGEGKLAVRNGVVAGFDLPAVDRQLTNLRNIGSLLGLVQAGLSGGTTAFSSLAASFHAANGVVTTRDARLDAQGGTATGVATIDLPRWTLNSRVDIRLATATAPPLGLRFEGPLDNPRKIVDVNALERYLVERGLGQALKGQQAGPPSGRQLLQDLLKGLGGR